MESRQNFGTYSCQERFSGPECPLLQKTTVGCLKELNKDESRVGLTPNTCVEFIRNHHTVIVESGAGLRSGFTDEEYMNVGCEIVKTGEEVYKKSKIIIKVLAPETCEFQYLQKGQIIMAFFNFNHMKNTLTSVEKTVFTQKKELFERLQKLEIVCIDYENIENDYGMRPLVHPMSEIAGHLAVQQGMKYLERQMGGSGVLIGSIEGVKTSRVLILGAGVAGMKAARIAAATGSHVTLMDINRESLRQVREVLPYNVQTLYLSEENLSEEMGNADLVIGAIIPRDSQCERYVVSKDKVSMMKRGSVIIDLAMWWGGNFETSKETTIEQPTFMFKDVIHFCATNIWSMVPRYSSESLSSSVLPYALQIANKDLKKAVLENSFLWNGMILMNGNVTNTFLSQLYNLPCHPMENIFKSEIEKTSMSPDLVQLKEQLHRFQQKSINSHFTIEA